MTFTRRLDIRFCPYVTQHRLRIGTISEAKRPYTLSDSSGGSADLTLESQLKLTHQLGTGPGTRSHIYD